MPAWRYWDNTSVEPSRARSKSLEARARASGGREVTGGAVDEVVVVDVDGVAVEEGPGVVWVMSVGVC